jgi:hypothetical protein
VACGYNVTYEQFTGGHIVPLFVADGTMRFFLGTYSGMGRVPTDLTCGTGP